jgi:hypothetical protein
VYMNCAPLTISGGAKDDSEYNSLPNMYVINLPTSECSTVEGSDQEIPNPGEFVQKAQVASIKAATGPNCAASAAAQTEGVSGYKSPPVSNGAGYSAPANGSSESTAAAGSGSSQATSPAGYNDGQWTPAATSAASSPTASPAPAYSSAAASIEQYAPSVSYPTLSVPSGAGIVGPATGSASAYTPAGTGSFSGSSSSSSGSSTDSSSGGVLCDPSHPDQFGVDVNGKTVWRAVAPGTTCDEVSAYRKRSLRYAHVRRHVQNAGRF